MAIRNKNPAVQHFNKISPHSVLAGGRMFFYEPGSSTTLKDTFSDSDGTIPNTNPVILDASGFEPDIFGEGSYRVELRSSIAEGNLFQWERDPVDFSSEEGAFGEWLSTVDYGIAGDNIVVGSDGVYYVSIATPNINNDPTTSPTFWTEFDLLKKFNINETYQLADPVIASNGFLYTSLISNNLGDDPTLSSGNWTLPTITISSVRNLLFGNFRINQREVTGSVVLLSGEYGHDRFRAGSGGCTYTFATSANVTTVTISAGTLEQEVRGVDIETGVHTLSWTGTAQGQIDGGGFAASGVTATLTGGTNAIVEFDTGTVSIPQLEEGANASDFAFRPETEELVLCQAYYFREGTSEKAIGACRTTVICRTWHPFPVTMISVPTLETNGTAADYKVTIGITIIDCSLEPVVTIDTSEDGANVQWQVAAGLTAESAVQVQGDFLAFNAEL